MGQKVFEEIMAENFIKCLKRYQITYSRSPINLMEKKQKENSPSFVRLLKTKESGKINKAHRDKRYFAFRGATMRSRGKRSTETTDMECIEWNDSQS